MVSIKRKILLTVENIGENLTDQICNQTKIKTIAKKITKENQ